MGAPLKKYGLEYTFGKDPAKIARNLKKGYLTRRDVTELVDHIKAGASVKASFDEHGKIQWMIGDDSFSPTTATNNTPFWIRRIVHFFTPNSEEALKEKVEVIKKAYEDLVAQTKAAEDAVNLNESKKAAEGHINTLTTELTSLKNEIKQNEDKIQILKVKWNELAHTLYRKSMSESSVKEDLKSLNTLDQTIENNFFGTWTLTDEEKFKLGKLEHAIFGEVSDKLKDKVHRDAGKEILQQKIQDVTNEIEDTKDQITAIKDAIEKLTSANVPLLATLEQKLSFYDDTVKAYIDQGLLTPEKKEEPLPPPVVEKKIKPDFASRPLDYTKIMRGQKIESSPLFNQKLLFISICNEDDFYKNSFCPALKSAALIVTANQDDATKLFAKWEKEIKKLAVLWKASKSENADIDSLYTPNLFSIIQTLDKINKSLASLDELKLQDFITNLSLVKIPEKMNLDLQIPLRDALDLVTNKADLSPLFSDTRYKNWSKEVQYLTAISTLKFYTNLESLEKDPVYRASSLEVLKKSASMSPPYIATAFANLAVGSSFIFDNAIGITAKLAVPLLAPKPETEVLQHKLNFYVPDRKKVEDAIEFSKTPARKKFDKAFTAFISSFMEDIIELALAKHTSDSSKIGKKGKEYNLQKLILSALNNSQNMKESVKAMIDYLEELEKPSRNEEELKRKKAQVEATKGASIRCTLELYKSVCEVFSRSGNIQILLKQLDDKILPDILENPLDLENIPVHEWLQHRVFKYLL